MGRLRNARNQHAKDSESEKEDPLREGGYGYKKERKKKTKKGEKWGGQKLAVNSCTRTIPHLKKRDIRELGKQIRKEGGGGGQRNFRREDNDMLLLECERTKD